jgi:hypothetical protein
MKFPSCLPSLFDFGTISTIPSIKLLKKEEEEDKKKEYCYDFDTPYILIIPED